MKCDSFGKLRCKTNACCCAKQEKFIVLRSRYRTNKKRLLFSPCSIQRTRSSRTITRTLNAYQRVTDEAQTTCRRIKQRSLGNGRHASSENHSQPSMKVNAMRVNVKYSSSRGDDQRIATIDTRTAGVVSLCLARCESNAGGQSTDRKGQFVVCDNECSLGEAKKARMAVCRRDGRQQIDVSPAAAEARTRPEQRR